MAKPVRCRRSPATVSASSHDDWTGSQVDQPDRDVTALV
jgi:hypothetical protein